MPNNNNDNSDEVRCGGCGSDNTIRINSREMKCRHCQRIIAWAMTLTCISFARGSATTDKKAAKGSGKGKGRGTVRTAAQMAEARAAANKNVLNDLHRGK